MREVLNIDLSKQQQSSDWGAQTLSEAQLAYAASDVLHLHALRERLDAMLAREGRTELAQACFEFLPTRARLDLQRLGSRGHFRAFVSAATCRARRSALAAIRPVSVTLLVTGPSVRAACQAIRRGTNGAGYRSRCG